MCFVCQSVFTNRFLSFVILVNFVLLPLMLILMGVLMVVVILSETEDEFNGKGTGSIVMCSQKLCSCTNM